MLMGLIWRDHSPTRNVSMHCMRDTPFKQRGNDTNLRRQLCSICAAPGRSPLDSCSDGSPSGPHTAGRTRPTSNSRQSLQHGDKIAANEDLTLISFVKLNQDF